MADINFKGTVDALFQGMNGIVSSKTVVGDAIRYRRHDHSSADRCVIWRGRRCFYGDKKEKGAGGLGGR